MSSTQNNWGKRLAAQVGLVLKGYIPSGRCYGYVNVPEEHPTEIAKWGRPAVIAVKQVPLKKQADVILNIFKMYANAEGGYSEIARKLRERGIDCPSEGKKYGGSGWSDSAVARILNNERYIGRVAFGKTKMHRDPDTLKLKQKPRPPSEWTRFHDPSLQIVPDELWEKVKARQAFVRVNIGPEKAGGMARRPAGIYPLGGLLHCGMCGNPMTLTHDRYMCRSALRNRGCKNKRAIARKPLERQFMEVLASSIRSEAHLAEVKASFMAELATELREQKALEGEASHQKQGLREEKSRLEAALRNLAKEVAEFGGNDFLREEMRSKNARLKEVADLLQRTERPATTISEKEVDAFLRDAFDNLADLLLGDPAKTKQELLKRVSSLTLTPVEHGGGPSFAVSGDLALFTEEETLQLLCSGTRTKELQPVILKLDGFVLKLDRRNNVIAVTGPKENKIKEMPLQQTNEQPDSAAIAA